MKLTVTLCVCVCGSIRTQMQFGDGLFKTERNTQPGNGETESNLKESLTEVIHNNETQT